MVGRRIRIGAFELFLHLGGANKLPLSYVDNCADAIVLAGISESADREVFNVVDDNLPTSTSFLKLYKQNVRRFSSIYLPYSIIYAVCYFGEKYYKLFKEKSPPTLNRRKCAATWKGNDYSNAKLKKLLGWESKVSFDEALKRYFEYQKADSM
jgi:nucleoside-diphosphate-sugar epimerase